jgi:hypothetical protein
MATYPFAAIRIYDHGRRLSNSLGQDLSFSGSLELAGGGHVEIVASMIEGISHSY